MMEQPLVSIGLPLFNEAKHVREALDSLVRQSYRNLEIIVSDNASTDETLAICREFSAIDPRVRIVNRPHNIGAIANFNGLVDEAKGTYFVWASGHDRWHEEFVAACVEAFEERPAACLCYTAAEWVDASGNVLGPVLENFFDTRGNLLAEARAQTVLWGLGYANMVYGMHRREALAQSGRFRKMLAPDVLLLLELAFIGEFILVPRILHQARATNANEADLTTYTRSYVRRIWGTIPPARDLRWMFWKMLGAFARLFWDHSPSFLSKFLNVLAALQAVRIRYGFFRNTLRQIRREASA